MYVICSNSICMPNWTMYRYHAFYLLVHQAEFKPGFIWVLESLGIHFDIFLDGKLMEKDYRSWKVLEICLIQAIMFSEFVVRNVCRLQGEMILKSWEWKDLRWNLESWEKNLESWKSPANSLKFVPDKGYETLKLKSNAALKSVILFGIKHYETPFY